MTDHKIYFPTATENVFDRSGLSVLSALEHPDYKKVFALLEAEQTAFLHHEKEFRSPEYIWPRDPLHCWSRIWEYPYVYFHLQQLKKKSAPGMLKTADIGSGVTFFPFAVAKLGYEVTAVDVDDITGRDLTRAIRLVTAGSGKVSYRKSDGASLPFQDGELDAAFCVSVLEHVPEPASLVAEMARILRPGGMLVLTLDMTLSAGGDIQPDKYARLAAELNGKFNLVYPETPAHPGDLLTTSSSPVPYQRFSLKRIREVAGPKFVWRQLVKPLLTGKQAAIPKNYELSVQNFVLRKV